MNQFLDRKDNTTSHRWNYSYTIKYLFKLEKKYGSRPSFCSLCLGLVCTSYSIIRFLEKQTKNRIFIYLGALKKFKSNFDSFLHQSRFSLKKYILKQQKIN